MTVRHLCSGMHQVSSWSRTNAARTILRDATGVEADPAQGLEGDLEQGVGPFSDTVDAADDLVERFLPDGEFTALGLFDRVSETGAGYLSRGRSG
jgi:hypothetical protein